MLKRAKETAARYAAEDEQNQKQLSLQKSATVLPDAATLQAEIETLKSKQAALLSHVTNASTSSSRLSYACATQRLETLARHAKVASDAYDIQIQSLRNGSHAKKKELRVPYGDSASSTKMTTHCQRGEAGSNARTMTASVWGVVVIVMATVLLVLGQATTEAPLVQSVFRNMDPSELLPRVRDFQQSFVSTDLPTPSTRL